MSREPDPQDPELRPLAEDPADEPEPPTNREELWQRIRDTSRHEVILEQMIRLGFWNEERGKGKAPAKLIREIGRLEREVGKLTQQRALLADRDRLLRQIRKRRLEEARNKRVETKKRREEERQERAQRWAEKSKKEILYLGESVSAGLGEGRRTSDLIRLEKQGLPRLQTAADLASGLGITLGELRFLAFHRKVSETTHYRRFSVPKKNGGRRLISAPMPRLKAAQRWILDHILERVPVHDAAHGFIRDRNIVTNARPHTRQDVVVNLDLENFFPTLTYRRVKGLFRGLGFSEEVSVILGLLSTEPEIDSIRLDGVVRHLHRGERLLPQGSPASPAISNLVCRRLDRRLTGLAGSLGFVYTRYADDLTFSAKGEGATRVGKLLSGVRNLVEHENFKIHPDKTRVMRKGRRQEVTGLVVNDRVSIDRRTRRRLRAILFQMEKDGPQGKRWPGAQEQTDEGTGHMMAALLGYASFVQMVHGEEGRDLAARLRRVLDQSRVRLPDPPSYPKKIPSWVKAPEEEKGAGQAAKKPWWKRLKFW